MDGFVLSKNCKEQSSRKSGKICCCRHRGEMASGLTRFRFQTSFLSSFLTWCWDGHQINSYQRYNWIIVYCGKMIITKVAFVITVMMKIFMNLSLDCWSYDVDSVIVTWYQTTKPNVRRLENQSFFSSSLTTTSSSTVWTALTSTREWTPRMTAITKQELTIANRSRVSCAHNMSMASMITPRPWNLGNGHSRSLKLVPFERLVRFPIRLL